MYRKGKNTICYVIVDIWKCEFQKIKYDLWQALFCLYYHLTSGAIILDPENNSDL